MKSKLTLRIDDDLKDAAKRLARARGESLSGLVENYFRILTEGTEAEGPNTGGTSDYERALERGLENLGPVTRRIQDALGSLSEHEEHGPLKKDDRRAAAEAASKKYE